MLKTWWTCTRFNNTTSLEWMFKIHLFCDTICGIVVHYQKTLYRIVHVVGADRVSPTLDFVCTYVNHMHYVHVDLICTTVSSYWYRSQLCTPTHLIQTEECMFCVVVLGSVTDCVLYVVGHPGMGPMPRMGPGGPRMPGPMNPVRTSLTCRMAHVAKV